MVQFNESIKLLGITLDATLREDRKVNHVIPNYTYHLRAVQHIIPLLTLEAAKITEHSKVTSRFSHANGLHYGTFENK
jgi:hypothetical protein